jgi:23S rRNA pseudouridine2605 synthase
VSGTPRRRGAGGAGQGGRAQGGGAQGGGQGGGPQGGGVRRTGGAPGATRRGAPGRPSGSRSQPPQPAAPAGDVHVPDGVRLQKVLAQAGVGSRRACEELIAAGRVEVDGRRMTVLGVRIDPRRSVVHVDGVRIQLDETLVYLALNKPLGVISAMSDPQGRPTLGDFVANREERLFHVGRLDADTEGLILLTNDGELAHRLSHPSYEVPKTYLVEVAGPVPRDLGRRLRAGVELEDGPATVDSFKVVDARPGKALLELVLHDGRNRVVRRLLAAAGHPVEQLVRTQVGPIRLGDLRTGRTRVLGQAEVGALMAAAGL